MRLNSRVTMRWGILAVAAAALLLAGAGIMYLIVRPDAEDAEPGRTSAGAPDTRPSADAPPATRPPADESPLPDVIVTLTQEAVDRAGIVVSPVAAESGESGVRIPGVVEANAYRQVVVTPVVTGRVTRVAVQLGDQVRRGQTIAQIYSPQLAEAQTRFLTMRAELDAATQQLRRTERLVELGAASKQELEQIHAAHAAHATGLEGARSQLVLLGMSGTAIGRLSEASEITATTSVPAPIDGVITAREANVGLNVDPSTKLFTVVDLSTVWVVGDLYEKDFSRVRVGSSAAITTTAYPEIVLRGKVSYIDPQVNPETRTARVRVEVGNPDRRLRLGMFAEMQMGDASGARAAIVPKEAVQNVGAHQVVYLVDPQQPGRFTERQVQLGATSGDQVVVHAGVKPGDVVVAQGSFFVRAERERLGLRPPAASAAPAPADVAPERSPGARPTIQTARITVSDQGFTPPTLKLRAGVPAKLSFVRTSEKTCATEVQFPTLNIRKALPLNQTVDVELTPQKGEIAFACGMNMLKGTIVGP